MRRKALWFAVACAGACGSTLGDADSDSKPRSGAPGFDAGSSGPGGGSRPSLGGSAGSSGSVADGAPPAPPELEEKRTFEAPRAGARFVYVANPRRDTVAVIDSATLAIRSVEAGDTPTHLVTVPGKDIALVVNIDSKDLTVLRTDTSGTRTTTLPVIGGANTVSVAPDGRHAIAWYQAPPKGVPRGATGSFQEVTLIKLAEKDTAVPLTVGFRPSEVEFASDGSAAFVVTEEGVSIIRFADVVRPSVAPLVRLGEPTSDTAARDISVTPDGKHALARTEGSAQVQLADLAAGTLRSVTLAAAVTDLDLSPGGDFALAVLREGGAVVRIPIPAGFTDAAQRKTITIEGETVGSAVLTSDGKTAVLYTTATPVERLVVLDLAGSQAPRPVRLKKAVRAVALGPDGRSALVVHTKVAGDARDPSIDVELLIDRSYGYSVVDLSTGFARLQLTDTDVGPLAVTPDGSRAFVLLPATRVTQRIDLRSFLVDDFVVGSPPLAIAALTESKRIFVSQQHPEGRISFIHWETGAVESVTGFELNGRIVQ